MLGEQAFGEILGAGVDLAVRIFEVAQEAVTDPLIRGGEDLFRSWDLRPVAPRPLLRATSL